MDPEGTRKLVLVGVVPGFVAGHYTQSRGFRTTRSSRINKRAACPDLRRLSCLAGVLMTRLAVAQQIETHLVVAPEGAAVFGSSVALSANLVIVGARGSFVADGLGTVYVFKQRRGEWIEEARLTTSDGRAGDHLGSDVAINEGSVLVGAVLADGAVRGSGAAYLFGREGKKWIEKAKLTAVDGLEHDMFGCAVALTDDHAVVGAMQWTARRAKAGAAYVFRAQGPAWVQQTRLKASDGQRGDMFGCSVAAHGSFVLVGAPMSDGGAGPAGAVYVYRNDGTTWVEEARLAASDSVENDGFGWSVSVYGDYAVIGALNTTQQGPKSGSAYVFRRTGGRWVEEARLTASDGGEEARFGSSVWIGERRIVVGAFWTGGRRPGGAAYVFERIGAGWLQKAKLVPDGIKSGDYLGTSVAATENHVLVGAMGRDSELHNTGVAYVFDLPTDTIGSTGED